MRGKKKLQPLKELKKQQTIALLESSLADPNLQNVPPSLVQLLQQQADEDIKQLIPHLESTGQILAAKAEKQLTARGEKEAGEMKKILEQQQQRIRQQQEITEEKSVQLSIPNLAVEEERQIEADRRHWEKRLEELAEEIKTEPERIQATYSVKAKRLEPVGLVYLWPVSG
jgi:NH3-dependent NAD+ synthetase